MKATELTTGATYTVNIQPSKKEDFLVFKNLTFVKIEGGVIWFADFLGFEKSWNLETFSTRYRYISFSDEVIPVLEVVKTKSINHSNYLSMKTLILLLTFAFAAVSCSQKISMQDNISFHTDHLVKRNKHVNHLRRIANSKKMVRTASFGLVKL